jgi:hypothetical protein
LRFRTINDRLLIVLSDVSRIDKYFSQDCAWRRRRPAYRQLAGKSTPC